MDMKKITLFTALLFFGFNMLSSCSKVEGKGGSSMITGKIHANKKNSSGVVIASYDAMDHDVFIVYGSDKTTQDDKVATSYDGTFKFEYLEKGDYTIYTYEKCNSCASGDNVIILKTTISKAKETVNLGTIEIFD